MSVTQTFSRSNCHKKRGIASLIKRDQCFTANFMGFYHILFFRVAIFAEISPCFGTQVLVVPQHLPVVVDAHPCALAKA